MAMQKSMGCIAVLRCGEAIVIGRTKGLHKSRYMLLHQPSLIVAKESDLMRSSFFAEVL